MKNCTDCIHADWLRTEKGRLHPSGEGKCTKEVKLPKLPASKYYIEFVAVGGGAINRREERKENCVYWARKEG